MAESPKPMPWPNGIFNLKETKEMNAYASAADAVNRLAALLNDPHHGLATWHSALADARLAVLKELSQQTNQNFPFRGGETL